MTCRKVMLVAYVVALTFALAACDSSTPTAITASPSPTSLPLPTTAPTAAPTSVPATLAPGTTSIVFEKTGGIAGIHDRLEISPQADVTYASAGITRTETLLMTTYGALLKQIETADFFNLNDSYDNGGVADDFYYTITVRQGDRTKTIRVAQVGGKDITPQPLQDLIEQLNNVLAPLAGAPSSPTAATTATTVATSTPAAPGTPGAAATSTPSSAGDTTITAVRTGGIAGVNDILTIKPGGHAEYTSRNASPKAFQLPASDYSNLLAQVDRADFFNLQDSYNAPGVADAFTIMITVSRGGRTKSVSATEGSQIPQGLSDLLAQITSILDAR